MLNEDTVRDEPLEAASPIEPPEAEIDATLIDADLDMVLPIEPPEPEIDATLIDADLDMVLPIESPEPETDATLIDADLDMVLPIESPEPEIDATLIDVDLDMVSPIESPEPEIDATLIDVELEIALPVETPEPEPVADDDDQAPVETEPQIFDLTPEMRKTSAGDDPPPVVPAISVEDQEPDGTDDGAAVDEEPAEIAPPVPDKDPTPDSERGIVDFADVTGRRFAVSGKDSADEMLAQAWHQLAAFNDLSQVMGTTDTLDSLVNLLIERLPKAIPNAQRGAILLKDDRGELLLKAHWPLGDHTVNMIWIRRAYDEREHFIWTAPDESDTNGGMPKRDVFHLVQSAIYVPLLSGKQVLGVMVVENNFTRNAFAATDLALMRAIASQVAVFVKDHVSGQERQQETPILPVLYRQFPPEMASRIFGDGSRPRIRSERVDPVTILASNVHRFTDLTEKMKPGDVVRMLNEMLDAFFPIIFRFDGVVNKTIDDSLLAVFGSPEKDDRQWEKAVQAALEMQQAVDMIREGRKVRQRSVFDVGISAHTGEAIHGLIGSPERTEYTVIGDSVNRAFMYCDAAGPGEVVISKEVYERVYHFVDVELKTTGPMHPDMEPDHAVYVVKGLKEK